MGLLTLLLRGIQQHAGSRAPSFCYTFKYSQDLSKTVILVIEYKNSQVSSVVYRFCLGFCSAQAAPTQKQHFHRVQQIRKNNYYFVSVAQELQVPVLPSEFHLPQKVLFCFLLGKITI